MTSHDNDGRSFQCYLCPFEFNRLNALRIHFTVKHSATEKDFRACTYCNKTFLNSKTFGLHLRIVCIRSYTRINGFQWFSFLFFCFHLKHEGITKAHKCPQCDKMFDRRAQMLSHAKIHSDYKEFICEACGHAFKCSKQLKFHVRKHTGEQSYTCNVCNQSLRSQATLKNHMRLHTGERPYECNLCEKTFVQRPNLLKHLMVHRKEKRLACTMCDKRFSTAYHLRLHQSVHTGAKPYRCDFVGCEKSFTQPGTMRAHKIKAHAIETVMAESVFP